MNDPERLMQRGANSFESRLLRAGRGDTVSEKSRRAILSGLGIGGATLWTGGVAAAVQKLGKGWVHTSAVRWAGAAALSGAVLWAGVKLQQASTPPNPAAKVSVPALPAHVVSPALTENPAPELVAPQPTPETPPKALVSRARSNRAPSPTSDKTTLADELAVVDLARAALARKDPAQALRLLDEHARRFSPRRLDAEATVLRIEALSAASDRATASRLGQAFLSKHPQGPYARRVRSLIGTTE